MKRLAYPTQDEIHPSGSIVYWKIIKSRMTAGDRRLRLHVRVMCGRCKKRRWVGLHNMSKRSRQGRNFTGICTGCLVTPFHPLPGKKFKGRFVSSRGYVHVHRPKHPMAQSDGYVYEHRMIMSNHLGRALTSVEHVHHINGKKSDNRIENLELVSGVDHCQITNLQKRVKVLETILRKHRIKLPR